MAARSRRKRRGIAPPLDLSSGFGFPFRQEFPIAPEAASRAEDTARAVLQGAGFELDSRSGSRGIPGIPLLADSRVWIGERGLRRRGVTSSTAVFPIVAVFVAGSILGGLDAYIVGSPLVGIFWVLGAAATSGIFWLVYGGTYDSELVMVTVTKSEPASGSGAQGVSVVLWAARVRSQIHSDVRVPSVVDGPLKLAREVGTLVREFQRRVVAPAARPPGTASDL
jgi:hypothetical protein